MAETDSCQIIAWSTGAMFGWSVVVLCSITAKGEKVLVLSSVIVESWREMARMLESRDQAIALMPSSRSGSLSCVGVGYERNGCPSGVKM